MVSQTSLSSFTQVSFVNLFGIFVSVVLTLLFLILGGHTLKYIKAFACKIKIIVNRAEDKNMKLKDFNYQLLSEKKKSPAFERIEAIFKNEIKRSRSLQFWNIVSAYMSKYNHVLYYPFRNRMIEKYDLLKPKSTFFTLIIISSLCVVWMSTIFLSSILQNVYTDVTSISLIVFIICTAGIATISTLLNFLIINRLFRLYLINIKNSFKVDYGHKFTAIKENLDDDLENDYMVDEKFLNQEESPSKTFHTKDKASVSSLQTLINNDQSNMNSTRKLLGEELERSDFQKDKRTKQSKQIIEELKEEYDTDNEYQSNNPLNKLTTPKLKSQFSGKDIIMAALKKKAIKDIFDLQVQINELNEAPNEDKFIFIEDKHAIGDIDLLQNEAFKGENKSNIITMIIMFLVLSGSAIVCCYLNYQFSEYLSIKVFYMFAGAFFGDMLLLRMLLIFFVSLIKLCGGCCKGYKKIQYRKHKEIKALHNSAINNMFSHKKAYQTIEQDTNDANPLKTKGKKTKEQRQQEKLLRLALQSFIGKHDDLEKHDESSMKKTPGKGFQDSEEESKEDDCAQEINIDDMKDNDMGGQKNEGIRAGFAFINPYNEIEPQIQNEKSSSAKNLMKNFQNALVSKYEEDFKDIMDKKQLVNDLVDYNLMLLRKIYDAYEERADKVLKNFRTDKHGVLRKRYMVPIINPNYPFEKMIEDLKNKKKSQFQEKGEEEGSLEAETVCQEADQQLLEAIKEEAKDDLEEKEIIRQAIDKFGNQKKLLDEITINLPQAIFEKTENEMSYDVEEDVDEWIKKKKQLKQLRSKLQRGEELSEEERKLLIELEKEEDLYRHNEIEELRNMLKKTEEEELRLKDLMEEEQNYRNRRLEDLLEKQQLFGLNEEEQQELKRLLEWQQLMKKKKLEDLRQKMKKGILSEEEKRRLQQLEDEELFKSMSELEILREKMHRNQITEEERKRLQELEDEELFRSMSELEILREKLRRIQITEEELRRLQELEDEELFKNMSELEILREKLGRNQITEEELRRLKELEEWDHKRKLTELEQLKRKNPPLSEEDQKRLRELEEELERLELKELEMKKQLGLLSNDEAERMRELDARYKMKDISIIEKGQESEHEMEEENPFIEQNMLNDQQEQFDQDQQSEQEQRDLSQEKQQDIQNEEESMQTEEVYSRITDKDNFADLPPVEVMNNVKKGSKPETPQEMLQKSLIEKEKSQVLQKSLTKSPKEQLIERSLIKSLKEQTQNQSIELQKSLTKSPKEQLTERSLIKSSKEQAQNQSIEQDQKSHVSAKSQLEKENIQLLQKPEKEQDLFQSQNNQEEDLMQNQNNEDQQNTELLQLKDNQINQEDKQEELFEPQKVDNAEASMPSVGPIDNNAQKQKEKAQENQDKQVESAIKQQKQPAKQDITNEAQQEQLIQKQKSQKDQQKEVIQDENLQKENSLKKIESINEKNSTQSMTKKFSIKDQQDANKMQNIDNQNQDELQNQNQEELDRQNQDRLDNQNQDELEEISPISNESMTDQIIQRKPQTAESLKRSLNEQQISNIRPVSQGSSQLMQQDYRLNSALSRESSLYRPQTANSNEAIENRPQSKIQQRPMSNLLKQPEEDDEIQRLNSHEQVKNAERSQSDIEREQPIEFGREDLELDAPLGAIDDVEESIYSHETTTILDEEKVSFMHIEHLPNQDNESDDSQSEHDMVYYNKDDLTNYSRDLGLNKVRAKRSNQPQYFSENDIQEVQESEYNDSERSLTGRRRRSRGQIQHNDLEAQSYNDQIDGRVKVDSWNLNYSKKKNKLKKKKLDKKIKDRMSSLQSIYGVDAKTLAGLQTGHKPKQLVGAEKDKGSPGRGGFGTNKDSDNSFRSTQNTFLKNQSSAKHFGSRASIDNASNMFTFQGTKSGMSKRWNDIESTLKGNLLQRSQQTIEKDKKSVAKRLPMSGMKKMTATQENFAQQIRGQDPSYLDEESKSNISRGDSYYRKQNERQENYSSKKGYPSNQKSAKQNISSQNRSNQHHDNNSYLEEERKNDYNRDSSVKRNQRKLSNSNLKRGLNKQPKKSHQYKTNDQLVQRQQFGNFMEEDKVDTNDRNQISNNDINRGFNDKKRQISDKNLKKNKFDMQADNIESHSESDEGVNSQNAQFQDRHGPSREQFRILQSQQDQNSRERQDDQFYDFNHSESDEGINQEKPNFDGNEFIFKKRAVEETTVKKDSNKISSKKQQSNFPNLNPLNIEDLEAQDFNSVNKQRRRDERVPNLNKGKANYSGHVSSQERSTSQKKGIQQLSDGSDIEMHYYQKQQEQQNFNQSPGYEQKPPLSGRKKRSSSRREAFNEEQKDGMILQNIYGDPYNISGNIHPGVSEKFRSGLPQYGLTDQSDNERENISKESNRRKLLTETDNEIIKSHQKRQQLVHGHGSHSPTNRGQQLNISQNQKKTTNRKMRHKSNDDIEEDQYIIGPNSNHSMIKKRDQQKLQESRSDDRYLLLNRQREIVQDLDSNRDQNGVRGKKRIIKKAARSISDQRDLQSKKLQEKQNERLRKKQKQAESALFAKNSNDETSQIRELQKFKKKKQQKEWVRKEVNYWLDYDSPYAEYLVARFREWSPQVRAPSARGQGKTVLGKTKINEINNVYVQKPNQDINQSRQRLHVEQQQQLSNRGGRNVLSNSPQRDEDISTIVLKGNKRRANIVQEKSSQKKNNKQQRTKVEELNWDQEDKSHLFVEEMEEP